MLSSKNSNKSNSLLKVSLLSSQTMEKSIQLKTYSFSNPFTKNINCLVQRTLSLVLKLVLKKKCHWRSRMIARDLDYEIYSSFNYNLITKDNTKKIISSNVFPEVPIGTQDIQ